jgi:hypothetical protein
LQGKQVFLKRMIVEVQDDLCVGITAGHVLFLQTLHNFICVISSGRVQ